MTITAAAIFFFGSAQFLELLSLDPQITLPDVDSAHLSGFGIGQGTYLVKKAALKLGDG